jgi:hypothetical protein
MPIKFDKDYVVLGIFLHLFLTLTVILFYFRSLFHNGYYGPDPIFAFFYTLCVAALSIIFIFYYCRLYAERPILKYLYNLGCFMVFFLNWFIWQIAGKTTELDREEFFFLSLLCWILGIAIHSLKIFRKKKTDIKGMKKDEIFE